MLEFREGSTKGDADASWHNTQCVQSVGCTIVAAGHGEVSIKYVFVVILKLRRTSTLKTEKKRINIKSFKGHN